jgi:hypothetical protein
VEHYGRYTLGLDRYVKAINKWYNLVAPPNMSERAQELIRESTPAAKLLFVFEALGMGLISEPEDGEQFVRAGLYTLVKDIIEQDGEPYSIVKILSNPNVAAAQMYFYKSVSERASFQLAQGVRYAAHVRAFETEGKRTYRVSPGLSDQLSNTVLKGLRCEDLRLPYKAISIEAPIRPEFQIWNNASGWHPFEGAYLMEDPYSTTGSGKSFTNTDDMQETIEPIRSIAVMLTGHSLEGKHLMDDAVFTFAVTLPDGELLDDQIEKIEDMLVRERNDTDWRGILRWLINVIIYSTWSDCEREHVWVDPNAKKLWNRLQKARGSRRKKITQQLKGLDQSKVIKLGGSIKVNRSVDSDYFSTRTGKTVAVHHQVSGHWRKQPHGKGRTMRKLIWIEPYWKGPEDAPIKQAVHELKSRTEA